MMPPLQPGADRTPPCSTTTIPSASMLTIYAHVYGKPGDDSMADFKEAGFTHSGEPLILQHDARRLPKLECQASA